MIRGIDDRAAFNRLRRHGIQVKSQNIRLRHVDFASGGKSDHDVRVAYSIGKRVGNAVVRNRVRRRIRGALEELAAADKTLPDGYSMISADPTCAELSYGQLRDQVADVLKKLELARASTA